MFGTNEQAYRLEDWQLVMEIYIFLDNLGSKLKVMEV